MSKPEKSCSDFCSKIKMIVKAIELKHQSVNNWLKLNKEIFFKKVDEDTIKSMKRTVGNFKKSHVAKPQPHTTAYKTLCTLAGVTEEMLKLDENDFVTKFSMLFSIDKEQILPSNERFIGSVRLGKAKDIDHIKNIFDNDLKGYWVGIHYWNAYTGDEIVNKDDVKHAEGLYIFRHLFYLYDLNKETKEIKIKFASARSKDRGWNYEGNMSVSEDKRYYFFLETIKSRGDVEVVMIIADFVEPFLSGTMLASTEKSGFQLSKPAASRIILEKITDIDNKECVFKKYVGIYHDSFFNENARKWINNKSDATAFSPNNDELLMDELKKSERNSPSITKSAPIDGRP